MTVPKLRAPVVLVHGLFGFSRLEVCGLKLAEYFPAIPEFLRTSGNEVRVASVSPTRGIADRAGQLKAFLDRELPGEPVHLLAHSMGGLDSRWMISRLGMADRVLTLTTLGTPHRGSSFADWGIKRLERAIKPVFEIMGVSCQAFYDLTTTNCKKFNDSVPDSPKVRYFSVAGRHPDCGWTARMSLLYQFVKQVEGPNDGVVSVTSATYGEDCQLWDGDHLSLANWPDPNTPKAAAISVDRKPEYAWLLGRLADLGF